MVGRRSAGRVEGLALALVLLVASTATALPRYGTFVDQRCTAAGAFPDKPFNPMNGDPNDPAQVFCGLCHSNASRPSSSLTAAGDQFRRSGHTDASIFCSVPVANLPPVFTPVAAQRAIVGTSFELEIVATDPEGEMLLLSAANLPGNAVFTDAGSGRGVFRWTPASSDLGAHSLTFHAADTGTPMAVASIEVELSVGQGTNLPPVLAPIGNQRLEPGQTLEFTLSASDPEGQGVFFGASDLPAGARLVGATFVWTPDASQVGQHTARFTVTDTGSPAASDAESIVISVGSINRPPVLAPIGDRRGPVASELRVVVTASDPDADPIALECSDLPAGAVFVDHGDGTGELVWNPAAPARAEVTCSATDAGAPPERDFERFVLSALERPQASDVRLDEAVWRAGDHGGSLRVRGTVLGPTIDRRERRKPVDVFAVLRDGTTVLLGSGPVGRREVFQFVLAPFLAPCSVTAVRSGEASGAIPVIGAPADCDEALAVRVRARISSDGKTLRIVGRRGPIGGRIVVFDADGGEALGSFPVMGHHGRFGGRIAPTSTPRAVDLVVESGDASWRMPGSVPVRSEYDGRDRGGED